MHRNIERLRNFFLLHYKVALLCGILGIASAKFPIGLILVSLALSGSLLFLGKVKWGIMGILFIRIFLETPPLSHQMFGLNIREIFGGLVFLCLIVIFLMQKIKSRSIIVHEKYVLLFMGVCLVSSIFSTDLSKAIGYFARFVSPFFFMLVISSAFKGEKDAKRFMVILILSGVVPVVIAAGQVFGGAVAEQMKAYGTFRSIYIGSHTLAYHIHLYLALAFFWLLWSKTGRNKKLNMFWILMLLVIFILPLPWWERVRMRGN